MATRVAELSVDEFKTLIQEVVTQTLTDLFRDPDQDLALREDFTSALQLSLRTLETGGETVAAESVAATLGLSW